MSITKKALKLSAIACAFGAMSAAAKDVTVDIYYTTEAKNRSFNIVSEINNMVAASNQYYADNNLDINLVPVYPGYYELTTNYKASMNGIQSIYRNSNIRSWRDEFKADFVIVIGSAERTWRGTTCGIAGDIYGLKIFPDHDTYESYAYNVTANDCGNTTLTFMHELGHNMGLGHSVRQGAEGGVYKWGVGYGVDYQFATVMAYPQEFNTSTHLPYFSDPDRYCATGEKCGVNNVADSQRALDLVTDTIANFR